MTQVFVKDPDAELDYGIDWSKWLATYETILKYTITPETGITVDSDLLSNKIGEDQDGLPIVLHADSIVIIWLSGGTVGERYKIACKITTSANHTDERTIFIDCQNL